MDDFEKPFLLAIDNVNYHFTSGHSASEVHGIIKEFVVLGIPEDKVEKLVSRLIDVVRNDF